MLEKRPPALVLVGRRGAGKSSLVNALFGAKVAELGHVTAQTGRGRWYDYERDGGSMSILDTRGVQEGSPPAEDHDGAQRARFARPRAAREGAGPRGLRGQGERGRRGRRRRRRRARARLQGSEARASHRAAARRRRDPLRPLRAEGHAAAPRRRRAAGDVDEKLRYVAEAERVIAAQDRRPPGPARPPRRDPRRSRRTCRGGRRRARAPTSAGGSTTSPSSSSGTCPTRAAPSWRERRAPARCRRSSRRR